MLLSMTDSAVKSKALRFRTAADRACVARAVSAALDQWSMQWESVSPDNGESCIVRSVDAELSSLVEASAFDWRALEGRETQGVWWTFTESGGFDPVRFAKRALMHRLFDDAADSAPAATGDRIADELVASAWEEWCAVLRDQLCAHLRDHGRAASTRLPSPASPEALKSWSGALLVTLCWCGVEMRLLLAGDAVDSLARQTPEHQAVASTPKMAGPRVTPVLQALTHKTARLHVELDPLEIDLGSLGRLKPGDVLLSGHCLEEMLSVRLMGARNDTTPLALCQAFLGQVGGRAAVELQLASASPS